MNKTTKHNYRVKRQLHKIDAAGKVLGRLASEVAILLMGKTKGDYSPQTDCGDMVELSNADKLVWKGNKFNDKIYYRYTGYPGGIRAKKLSEMYRAKPELIIKKCVYNMLPNNRLRAKLLKRLKFV